jgi:hypothetical protein
MGGAPAEAIESAMHCGNCQPDLPTQTRERGM